MRRFASLLRRLAHFPSARPAGEVPADTAPGEGAAIERTDAVNAAGEPSGGDGTMPPTAGPHASNTVKPDAAQGGSDGEPSGESGPGDGRTRSATARFRVESTEPGYRPEECHRPAVHLDCNFQAVPEGEVDPAYTLILLPDASRAIQGHVEWGHQTRRNCVEQGGLLVGRVFRDPSSGETSGWATAAIPGMSASGSSAFLQLHHQTWAEMLRMADGLGDDGLQVIGWYHTHPGSLSVFMSGTDRATQRRMFYADWHFAMVLNPQRRHWRVFHGADCLECAGFAARAVSEQQPGVAREPRGL